VSASGNYSDASVAGGIDKVDPSSYVVENIASKTSLGGAPGDIVVLSSTKGYVVVSDSSYVVSVRKFTPSTGAVGSVVYTTGGYTVGSIVLDKYGYLLIPDMSSTNPGIVFVDTNTDLVARTAVSTGLPPYSISIITY
jgi:hypothetical protein